MPVKLLKHTLTVNRYDIPTALAFKLFKKIYTYFMCHPL